MATLAEFTVETIAVGLNLLPKKINDILITGGGHNNVYLMNRLKQRLNINFVNAKELENPKKSGLVLLTKSNHSDSDFEERPINTLQIENSQLTFNALTAHLQKETQAKISDFDDHLQDVSKDFRNDSLF